MGKMWGGDRRREGAGGRGTTWCDLPRGWAVNVYMNWKELCGRFRSCEEAHSVLSLRCGYVSWSLNSVQRHGEVCSMSQLLPSMPAGNTPAYCSGQVNARHPDACSATARDSTAKARAWAWRGGYTSPPLFTNTKPSEPSISAREGVGPRLQPATTRAKGDEARIEVFQYVANPEPFSRPDSHRSHRRNTWWSHSSSL